MVPFQNCVRQPASLFMMESVTKVRMSFCYQVASGTFDNIKFLL